MLNIQLICICVSEQIR